MTEQPHKYEVVFTSGAARKIKKLPSNVRDDIIEAARQLAVDPRPPGAKKLTGRPAWRIRIGSYRVIYEIVDTKLTVTVVRAGHRRDVYK